MPLEIEIKLSVDSHDPVRDALRRNGAEAIGDFLETNWILDAPDKSLLDRGCGLRVRLSVDHPSGRREATLTFKGPRAAGPFKVREEIEIGLSDADRMIQVLGLLGFTPALRYQKRRQSWRLCACRVELDEPARIGKFVEIEGPDQETIRQTRSQLGLAAATVENATYVELIADYCDAHGIADRTLMLASG